MDDARRACELYGMMADRCARSGFADNQAQVYREMVDFMSQFGTVDEMTGAIRNSPYYLAPGAALVKDKAIASARAAEAFEMHDVAQVYYDKVAQIDADITEMYTSAFHVTAQNLRTSYERTRECFNAIYDAYATLRCAKEGDDVVIESALKKLREGLSGLIKPSDNFSELAHMSSFRQMVGATDEGYSTFVSDIEAFLQSGEGALDFSSRERNANADEADAAWGIISSMKREIKNAHGQYEEIGRVKECTAYAPADPSGHYTYR